jgi:hypothetical protein
MCVFSAIGRPIVRSTEVRALLVIGLVGCRAGAVAAPPERDDPAAAPDLSHYQAHFELDWDGAPIGEARETLAPARGGGVRFERRETWQVRRGAALVSGGVTVRIAATPDLEPTRIEVSGTSANGRAVRAGDGWRIEVQGEASRTARGLPLEILPLLLARRRLDHWSGAVLLAGMGFAPAHARVLPDGDGHRRVLISGPAGILDIRIALAPDGTVASAVGPDLSARRAGAVRAPRPPDLIALGELEVTGAPSPELEIETGDGRRLHLPAAARCEGGCAPAVPDPLPSPALRSLAARMVAGARSPAEEVRSLARGTARLLADDLAAGADSDAARVAARGRADCVGHAALFAALARARGHTVRLVTGFRLDGRRLVRHAWTIALLPDRALALDPTTGELVDGRYLPLAVHGAAAAEVALASELAYAGLTGARARFIAPRSARSIPRTP